MPGGNRVGAFCADEFVAENVKLHCKHGERRGGGVWEVFGAVLTLLSAAFILFTFPLTGWMCAKMIVAEGEVKASRALREAASGLSPVAFHLRYLQSLSSVQSTASIVVVSLPTELLDMFLSHQP